MTILRAALVIQHCPAGNFDTNLARTLAAVSRAAARKADVVVFPEMNLTGYVTGEKIGSVACPVESRWIQKLQQESDRHNLIILTGLVEQETESRLFATHLIIRPGLSPAYYRKLHLSPFEARYFTPGDRVRVFEGKGVNFGIQLCYDAHFPELSTSMALKKADIIFIPHASPRGTSDEKFTSWMRHLTARAFDNGVFVVAVNQTGENGDGLSFPGVALAIGPDGHLVSKNTGNIETIHMVEMDMDALDRVRSHKMRYFLPNRRANLVDE
ncbi:MAG: amidohydrolase [Desulfobacterales bacterium]|nr:amidohydrolase [Desulfobacterales bacterium]